jgi:hypothetical protein
MDLLDQMLAEAEANMDVDAHEELEMELARSATPSVGGRVTPAGMHTNSLQACTSHPAAASMHTNGLRAFPSAPPPPVRAGPTFMVVGAADGGWESQVKPGSAAQLAAPAEELVEGPPPPPEGAEDAPRPPWGTCHLCQTTGSAAFARFGGGGSSDVPTACSKLVATGPTGRAYWEVRFDKKGAGLCKVGLAHFHEGGPGDPGSFSLVPKRAPHRRTLESAPSETAPSKALSDDLS